MKHRILSFVLPLLIATAAFAQMHYPATLNDELTGQPISALTTKCAILIHGWNPDNDPNCYAGFEWANLLSNLGLRLGATDWGIVAYDWHTDAATGSEWNLLVTDFFDLAVASTAAFNAQTHGLHLATQLNQLSPNLREVHFIAHSAGSWAARQATERLLQLNPYVVVQITLLDPFIPDPSGKLYGGDYSDTAMNGMQFFSGNERIQRLECYYADDSPLHGWNAWPRGHWTGPTYNTQEPFSWRNGIDIDHEVDWGNVLVNPPLTGSVTYLANYDWHSGPIQFYADAVYASIPGNTPPSGLSGPGCPFDYRQMAWGRSLYAWESLLPRITTQPASVTVAAGLSAVFGIGASAASSYEWYKVGGSYVGSGSNHHQPRLFERCGPVRRPRQ